MRKAAGFLLILLLATLVVISTSSGDENDSSHDVHLNATYGPQLGVSCDVCHGTETPPTLSGPSNLATTAVCDTCHSPDGAYDGVNDPDIGARNNWDPALPPSSLIFNGSGDFQTGKEKWCVGCHDGVPSVINSVSAPNIAGESNSDCTAAGVPYSCCTDLDTGTCVDFGYYHTGHGKYVSESITCLACHDPDSAHVVDGVARSYSAGSDNYQAGYRLKLVGGQAPLVIPRPLTPVTADQFRQCFSCHNSAPFMNFDNYNTNFRADFDEDNLCVALDPPLNRHWEHLSITEDKYDSDWDGVSADSPPSCPACHNVHGPRVRAVPPGITNAPAMIRTGELIGREIEGALDLDYFINPCPDPQLLSSTNETVGSTGGMMIEYSPTGNGTIVRNGVCDMCHNEAQPYWRAAKKLPANDFSLDGHAAALWSLDNGALTTDSIGTNTLADNNTVGTDTVNLMEGDASADFESSNSEYLSITNDNLNSGFPLKNGESGTFSLAFWYKAESQGAYSGLVTKNENVSPGKSFMLRDDRGTLQFYIGYNTGSKYELLDASYTGLTTGVWYHIGATFDNTTKEWQLRVWDDNAKTEAYYANGTATNNISLTDAPFAIGAWFSGGAPVYPIDGLIDEVVVFRDILSPGDMDQIRQGGYAEVFTPTTTTTLFPPTTTTTLPYLGNDFSLDGHAAALWGLDNGALTTDSIGTNTLADNNTVGTDTVTYIEGDASADFESSNSEYLSITNDNLNSGFPLKSGGTGTFSVAFWYKAESKGAYRGLVTKNENVSPGKSFMLRDDRGTLQFYIGINNGAQYSVVDDNYTGLTTGVWYHIGATFDNTTREWQLRVWDDNAKTEAYYANGTATNNISLTDAPFAIGAWFSGGAPVYPIDGLIDEVVVFRDILSPGDMDQIRQGGYAEVFTPTTTTTLFPPTTTTTLPRTPNDFSLDGHAAALWGLDNGALTTDSIGTNTLADNNTVGTDTVTYIEGDASADFESSNSEYLSITNDNLNSGFPLKSGGTGTFSVAFWYKAESQGAYRGLVTKNENVSPGKSFMLRDDRGTLQFYIGYNFGSKYEILDASYTGLTPGVWYHIGATFDNTTREWQLRVWDNNAKTEAYYANGTATNNISLTDAPFAIGAWFSGGAPVYPIDGLIDEVVVFRDILSPGDMDQIRQGGYAEVFTPTTTTTLFPPTTTTTLPYLNDFSLDGHAAALWGLDNGALTTDSIGTNTLADNNTVGTDTVTYIEGDASADFESSNSEYLSITNDNLNSGFPLKSGGTGTFSVAFWYKAESQGAYRGLVTKNENVSPGKSFMLRDDRGTLQFYIGYNFGSKYEILDASYTGLTPGVWYHIGATFDNTTKEWQLRVWDNNAKTEAYYANGTATNNISLTDAPFAIGAWFSGGAPVYPIDGLIDEVVVFRDILSPGDMDQIRQGGYAEVFTPTTTTTLFPPTTTTTLPRTPNDFSLDGHAAALWGLDNGALTTDSIGTNTLADNNTVGTDTVTYIEGDASADFESSNSEYLSITNDNLNSGFPLKSGGTGTFSVAFWYKAESQGAYRGLVSKNENVSPGKSFMLRDDRGTLQFYIGYNFGSKYELLDASYTGLTTGVWYHIGATFDNTTKEWQLRVWDDNAKTEAYYANGTATNNISLTDAPFAIGAWFSGGAPVYPIDGLIDEVVVFRDILSPGDMDQIRQGGYAEVFTPTTTTTLFPPTTTTTLPPSQNNFSGADNLEALWLLDNGPLTDDSSGKGNTLTDNNNVCIDNTDKKVGDASANLCSIDSEYLSRTDADLNSSFPLNSRTGSGTFSITFWYKPKSQGAFRGLVSKNENVSPGKSFMLRDDRGTLQFYIGRNYGANYEILDASYTNLTPGVWYHIGATFDNTTREWQLRVWDDNAKTEAYYANGTATNNISLTDAPFAIGAWFNGGAPVYPIDGLIDEVVVFRDILTPGDIDRIRQGTYEDLCPTDPNKSEPGACGCGYTEWGGYCIENDSSHSAHLTEASGPQIASCDVCHVDTYVAGGQFTDGQVFANTQVCDTCHSPGGAYNGVDSTSGSVGAKDNWVSGVYDTVSGGLLLGKEKWCIGCHDDGDSTINEGSEINGVIAPNMAGDDIEYGYYKTGHGKHGNEKINCLACHDPAVMHVDGDARTYSAAADNYQAGYRLKMVDGGVALEVPRSGQGTVEQFRLCFSCHDSAPYVNFDNPDTNFRSDVNNTCVPLVLSNPADKVNKHYYHLFNSPVWDSDWDGVPSDSAPSCTTCHNVHGPRLKAGATHAPAMIRTGELIGRYDEGALNLDYFINPCRDTVTSPTNELSGSTGGVFMDDPQQSENPQLRGGVCGMCHSTDEPYWRDANISIFSCDKCHTNVPHTVVQIDTDNDLSYNAGYPCSNCHDGNNADLNGTPLDSWTDIESEHNVSTNGDGSCLTCHQSQRQEVIDAIALGADPTNCLNCHSDKDHNDHAYDHATNGGSLGYAPITVDTDCTTSCHSGDVVQQVHGGTCTTCHTATYPDLLTSPNLAQFAFSTTTCTDCHNSGLALTKPFHGITSATVGTIHDLSSVNAGSGTETDCAECHTFADGPAQILAHMGTEAASSCDVCHSAADSPNTSATGVIATATSGEPNSAVTCEQCHSQKGDYLLHGLTNDALSADDVSSVHDNFLDENGFATSTCSNCHSAGTEQERINLHTTNGSCLTCHQNTTDMGGITPQDIIDDGKGPGGGSQHCGACHISINTDWKNHTVDHTFVLEDTNCTSCHDTNAGPNLTAPNSDATPYVGVGENHNPKGCYTCHDDSAVATRGNYLTLLQANQNGYVDAMPAGLTNPTCTDCHNIAYFDSHTHGTGTNHTVSYDGGVDQVASGTGCDDCHTPISTWSDITTLHDYNGCATCHSYTQATGEFGDTPEETVASVILASGATTCADCHTEKAGQPHGGHDATAFSVGTDGCDDCHTVPAEGVADMHNSSDCLMCHTAAGGGYGTARDASAGEMDTYNTNGIDANPDLAATGTDTYKNATCLTCHDSANAGVNAASMGGIHHDNKGNTTDCTTACHTVANHKGNHLGRVADAAADCTGCHTAVDIIGQTDGIPVDSGNVLVHDTCTDCHEFNTTPSTAMNSILITPDGTRGVTTMNDSTPLDTSDGGGNCTQCHTTGWQAMHLPVTPVHNSLVTATGTVGAAGAGPCDGCHFDPPPLVDAGDATVHNACASCHSTNGSLVTTNGTDTQTFSTGGNCETCHVDRPRHGQPDDHVITGYVTQAANCAGCHDATADDLKFVDPNDNLIHDTCSTCHTNPGALDWTLVPAASGGVGGGDCTGCHSDIDDGLGALNLYAHDVDHADPTRNMVNLAATCQPCHDTAVEYPLFVDAGDPVKHSSCDSCHTSATDLTLVENATDGAGGGADCQTCHTGTWEAEHPEPTADHTSLVTVVGAASCSICHTDTLVSGATDTHNGCSSCHNAADGALVTTLGTDTQTFSTGGDCTTCHGSVWDAIHTTTPDHSSLVTTTGAPDCASCHENQLDGVPTTTHLDDCSNCHNTSTGALVTILGTDTTTFSTGGNCETCHGTTWDTIHAPGPDHTSLVTTNGTNNCASCHENQLDGPETTTHLQDCSNCHNTTGALVTTLGTDTTTFSTGGNCETCHTGTWVAEHTTPTPDHSSLVTTTGAPDCASCHENLLDGPETTTHLDDCSNCHNTSTGALVTTLGTDTTTFSTGGDCTTCHGANWGILHAPGPDHSSLVTTVGAPDCGSCHEDLHYGPETTTHLEDCSNCHNTSTGALVTTLGTDTQTFSTGGNCETCHGTTWDTIHATTPDHSSLVTTTGAPDCASCHENLLDGPETTTHLDDCSNCHNTSTGALVTTLGTDTTTFSTGGNCETCHGTTWDAIHTTTPDHSSLVTTAGAPDCASCHENLLDGPETTTHLEDCSNCHNTSTGALVTTLGTDTTTFSTGGNCETCHGTNWGILHAPGPDHSSLVTTAGAPDCASCHEDLHYGPETTTHLEDCSNCHNTSTGALVTTLGTDTQTFSTGGNCETCHGTTWDTIHATTPDHSSLVTTAGAPDCASCHENQLDGVPTTTHLDDCSNCHNTSTGALVTTLGTDTTTFSTGGNCETCHGTTWDAIHTTTPDHSSLVTTAGAPDCASCHENLLDGPETTTHLEDCSNCHNTSTGALVTTLGTDTTTFSTGGNCETCHGTNWGILHAPGPDHSSLVTTAGAPDCASCHEDLHYGPETTTHLEDCSNCHNTSTGALVTTLGTDTQTFSTGGNCETCHGTTWDTIHTTTPDHSSLVTTAGAPDCASCHENQLDGVPTTTHLDDCSNCHNTSTGALVTTLGTDTTTFSTGGNCETCHGTTWDAIHTTTPDHSSLVTTTGAPDCASCHENLLDGPETTTHLEDCSNCHNTSTGALVTTLGTDTTTFSTGGDCETCHGTAWGTIHAPGPDHSSLVTTAGAPDCASCHEDLHYGPETTTHLEDCSNCHNTSTGALVTTLGTDTTTFSTGGNCETCHGTAWDTIHTTTPTHISLVTTAGTNNCDSCHENQLDGPETTTHLDDCSNCHNTSTGALVTTLGTDTTTFSTGGNCETCHTGTWEAEHPTTAYDHLDIVTVTDTQGLAGAGPCGGCHSDPPPLVNNADATVHNACISCHNSTTGALFGSGFGKSAPGNCETCHIDKPSHGSVDHVATSRVILPVSGTCDTCHDASADDGNFVDPANSLVHDACTTCHTDPSGGDYSLVAAASGGVGGGDCTGCHSDIDDGATLNLYAHDVDHDTANMVNLAAACQPCHDTAVDYPLFVDAGDPVKHISCDSCHTNATDLTLVPNAIAGAGGGADCTTCHPGTWEPNHTTDPGHTGITVAATSCGGSCHDDTLVSAAPETHDACISCHDSTTGALIGSAFGNPTPTDCTTCHTESWETKHTTDPGHTGITVAATTCGGSCHDDTLVSAAPETHDACISCHDSTTGALIGSAFGNPTPTDCTTCHTESWETKHTTDPGHTGITVAATTCGGSCHDDTLVSAAPETHDACISCHDSGDGTLIGSAFGNPTPTDCTTCHTESWETKHTTDPGHTGITVAATTCGGSCHDDTLVSVAPETHDACISCHDSGDGALIGSAFGNPTPTDCTTCHTESWETKHTTDPGHTGITVAATTCGGSCHDDTFISAAPETHDACISCHDSGDGSLIGSAFGNPTPTDCTTCHTESWETKHTTTAYDHLDIVTVTGTEGTSAPAGSCGGCHSDPPLLVDPADNRVHDYCIDCHDATDGSMKVGSSAEGASAPGNCETCHVNKESHGSIDHEAFGYIEDSSTLPGCQSCHVGDTSAGGVHAGCFNCHDTGNMPNLRTDNQTPPISSYAYLIPAGGGTCEDCHNGHNIHEEPGVDVTQTPPQMCGACHGGTDKRFSDFSEIKEHHYNLCSTCHESTDQNVQNVVNQPGYDGLPTPVHCIDCHAPVPDHLGHPLVKAGIRDSIYADDAVGQQTLTCFKAGCHAGNMVEEHLSPRGIAYKNYSVKYGQLFTCEMCHANKYPKDTLKRGDCIEDSQYDNNAKDCVANGHTWSGGKICSDPQYTDQTSCELASPTWNRSVAECSDPQYPDQTSCEAGSLSWNDIVINSDSIINTAILNGLAGNFVYCSDCHKESVTRDDVGVCSDPGIGNEVECIYECTNSSYTTQVECLQNGFTWDVPSLNTWTADGYCTDIRYSTEADCLAGETPVWYAATLGCSDPQYTTQGACEGASTYPEWYNTMPYSIHAKYNGVGIYSFSEMHHKAEVWTGDCSIGGITDEDECYNATPTPGIWTPNYTPGNTFVGNGDCIACHKDPRAKPYDHYVCQDGTYTGNDAGCIGAGLAVYGGTCSDPQYKNTYDCTDNGGTWSGGTCLDYSKDETSCTGGSYSWITHPAGASKALPAPQQLPCVTCHADVDAVGDTLKIYKNKTSVQVDPLGTYGGWTHTPSGPVANTVLRGCASETYTTEPACTPVADHSWYEPLGVCFNETITDRATCDPDPNHHWETPCSDNQYDDQATCQAAVKTWEGTQHEWSVIGGNIQSYGACIFCHKMRPYHAYPGPPEDVDIETPDLDYSDGLVDPVHFPIASRGVLNVFYGKHRYPYQYYKGTGQQGDKGSYQDIRDADGVPDNSVTWWADVIYDPQADPTGMVPTADYCSDGSSGDKTACESAGHWWRPGHRLGEPEYFSIPTFDLPLNDPNDTITIDTSNGATEYTDSAQTIYVVAETNTSSTNGGASTNKVYAIWAGVKKAMALVSSSGGTDTWDVTFTAADGVPNDADAAVGRVYVIMVDESGDNHDLLWQATHDEHVR